MLEGGANGITLWDIKIFSLLYADDLVLIAESEEDLKLQMTILGSYSDDFEMEINPKKTKAMIFNDKSKTPENTVFGLIGNHEIKTTNHYKYLGVTINNKGSFTEHVSNIVDKAQKCLYAFLAENGKDSNQNSFCIFLITQFHQYSRMGVRYGGTKTGI